MPTAAQWRAAVERHQRRRTAALHCCEDCRLAGKQVHVDPEDAELWRLLGDEPAGRPLVDVLAEEAGPQPGDQGA